MVTNGINRARGSALFTLLSLCLICAGPAAAWADTITDPAAAMYVPSRVDVIALTIPKESIEALEADPVGAYQPAEFSLAETDGTPTGVGPASAPLKVEVRLKGHAGSSFRPLSGKAAFKIKFNKAERFLGLKKLTLNNMVEDPSMIHETLAYSAFRAAGVPAPRTSYAYLRVNGADYGLYLNLENLDDLGLEKRFGAFDDPQHLYEGEYGSDVTPGGEKEFAVDEGDEEDLSDLEALIAATNTEAGPGWLDRMQPAADLGEMTRMWAVEKYIGFWDGYAGRAGELQPNNFYLYSDALGRFQMLPWGTDQTWDVRLAFDGEAGLLFDRCLADPECLALYRTALAEVRQTSAGLGLDALAQSLAAALGPWQAIDPRREDSPAEIAAGVEATREFIAERPGELSAWLGDGPAPVVPESPEDPRANPSAPAALTPQPVQVGRPTLVRGVLVSRLSVPEAGQLIQRARIKTAKGDASVCSAGLEASGGGQLTVRCRLSEFGLRRLRARWLRIGIETRFTASTGRTEVSSGRITIPRTPPGDDRYRAGRSR